jgi:hypothetical protein
MQADTVRRWAAANWFVPAFALLLGISWLFTRSVDWGRSAAAAEAVTLFDWAVTVPLLYFLCYRRTLKPWIMAVRLLALACLGVWIAGSLVPSAAQILLPHLSWPRTLGLAVLMLVELRLILLALKLAFEGKASAEELADRSGAPPWLARLMLLEARFWRAVWRLISRR